MGTVVIPGAGYGGAGETWIHGGGSLGGGSVESCNWPYVEVSVPYTSVTSVPGTPGDPGQPYIPPTAAQVDENNNAGWNNSCSSSVKSIEAGKQITFNVYHDSRGFFVGLDKLGKELQYMGLYRFGVRFSQSGIEVFESNESKVLLKNTLHPDDIIKIKRYPDGSVIYQVNDIIYKSLEKIESADEVYAYGIGYQAGDKIIEAVIDGFVMAVISDGIVEFDQTGTGHLDQSGYMNFDQIGTAKVRGDTVEFDQVGTSVWRSEYNGIGDLDMRIMVPVFHGEQEPHNALDMDITTPVFEADDDYVPPRLSALDMLIGPVPLINMEGVQVQTGDLDVKMTVPALHAEEEDYSALDMDICAVNIDAHMSPPGYMLLYNDMSAADQVGILKDVIMPLYAGLKAADNVQMFKDALLVMHESVTVDDQQDIFADREIAINEICSVLDTMRFSIDDLPDHTGGLAWVMNIETGATSLFLDYDFNSFLELDGNAYGVTDGNIWRLQETSVPVPASGLDYGLSKFGKATKKRIPHFYAACASGGKVYLRLMVDGHKAEYFALSYSDYVEPNKIDVGRGLFGVYWNPVIIAPEGVSIDELESLEFQPMVFKRRV